METLQKIKKQYDNSDRQDDDTQPNYVTNWSELKEKKDSSSLFIKLTLLRYNSSIRTSRD